MSDTIYGEEVGRIEYLLNRIVADLAVNDIETLEVIARTHHLETRMPPEKRTAIAKCVREIVCLSTAEIETVSACLKRRRGQ